MLPPAPRVPDESCRGRSPCPRTQRDLVRIECSPNADHAVSFEVAFDVHGDLWVACDDANGDDTEGFRLYNSAFILRRRHGDLPAQHTGGRLQPGGGPPGVRAGQAGAPGRAALARRGGTAGGHPGTSAGSRHAGDPGRTHRRTAIVTQEPFLFASSVMANIRCGRPEASDEEVREAARGAFIAAARAR